MSIPRAEVYASLDSERDYQDFRWGLTEHEIPAWVLFMEDHLAKARRHATEGRDYFALHEVRKVMALGVACMEQHGAPRR